MSETTGTYTQTARSTPTRYASRASYDRAAVHAVIDEALVCHVGFIRDAAPVVLPTVHARAGDVLYIHGSSGGRFSLLDGEPVGVTITLVDCLVLARSWLHHSAAYRSVVIHGTARIVTDGEEKLAAMASLIDRVARGRAADTRPPTPKELAKTAIVAIELAEASLKVRGDQLAEEPGDEQLPHWAGVIPLKLAAGVPVPAADLVEGVKLPDYLIDYSRG
ncbi:MAG TPA: pyridoxamine 5'-phosphate oxidase family protein [Actinocrinis sp.]|uniref:pyridoxamine 5'-phosphate oxidase family protein n=1 Tax=Actinocrinis sp. TaxID=1920516 RepID=UPI002DDCBFE0|nr:pyridoxamine 5'-phosphate oxidase family protein [Actinocrinis sp.]HEV2342983.1 pyridoxamine 5'-phosphate oxidase family protein [Actinocrinis sp.]